MQINTYYKMSYRFPYEFLGYGHTWKQAFSLWFFHTWKDAYCIDIYYSSGIRILGIEISKVKSIM